MRLNAFVFTLFHFTNHQYFIIFYQLPFSMCINGLPLFFCCYQIYIPEPQKTTLSVVFHQNVFTIFTFFTFFLSISSMYMTNLRYLKTTIITLLLPFFPLRENHLHDLWKLVPPVQLSYIKVRPPPTVHVSPTSLLMQIVQQILTVTARRPQKCPKLGRQFH